MALKKPWIYVHLEVLILRVIGHSTVGKPPAVKYNLGVVLQWVTFIMGYVTISGRITARHARWTRGRYQNLMKKEDNDEH